MEFSDDLICLSYGSKASFPTAQAGSDPQVNRILVHSRRANRASEIGGVLHFGQGFFFQYLEGPADRVDALYARICRDPRHEDVQRLTRRPIRSRRFRDWSMKFVVLDQAIEDVLQRHGLAAFNPYQFTPAMIDDLVVICTLGPEAAPDADVGADRAISSRPWWRRIFSK
ncbi:MAG: BLUF domain-containing protein [Wenzhouxiangellaceae bacterium]|nr:BLUF domain-containing protein [Wenzhouxiangellaceae bacterium]